MIDFSQAALCLKTLAHPHRLEIAEILIEKKELSVGEIADLISIKNNVVSEHLMLMKDRGFLSSKKQGRKVFYYVTEPILENIIECIKRKFS